MYLADERTIFTTFNSLLHSFDIRCKKSICLILGYPYDGDVVVASGGDQRVGEIRRATFNMPGARCTNEKQTKDTPNRIGRI